MPATRIVAAICAGGFLLGPARAQASLPSSVGPRVAAGLESLSNASSYERRRACEELARIGAPAIGPLVELARHHRDELGSDPRANLTYDWSDPDPKLEERPDSWLGVDALQRNYLPARRGDPAPARTKPELAIVALRMIGIAAAPALADLLEDCSLSRPAGEALRAFGPSIEGMLRARLPASGWCARIVILELLVSFRDRLTDADRELLLRMLSGPDRRVRQAAAWAFLCLEDRGVPWLVDRLASRVPLERNSALALLGALETRAEPALPRILALLGSEDPTTTALAIQALPRLATQRDRRERAAGALADLAPTDAHHALFAVEALARLGVADKRVWEYLCSRLDDSSGWVRHQALDALEKLDYPVAERLPLVVAKLQDEDVFGVAVQQLTRCGVGGARHLLGLLGATDERLRTLLRTGCTKNGAPLAGELARIAGSRTGAAREDAIVILASFDPKPDEAQRALATFLASRDEDLCMLTLRSLTPPLPTVGPIVPALVVCLGNRSDAIRREAAAAVARAGPHVARQALPSLLALLEGQASDLAKDAALEALICLGPEASAALPLLERLRAGAGPLLEEQVEKAIAAVGKRR